MIACSAATGEPLAVLHDRKLLIDLLTAAVGGLATDALSPG
jgi:ornithine cyclodeaminase/alanine dehydrogenase-like protein (mu-crystallin family)